MTYPGRFCFDVFLCLLPDEEGGGDPGTNLCTEEESGADLVECWE